MASVLQLIRGNPTKVVVGTATAMSVLLTTWPYMWEGEFLSKWFAIAAILSVTCIPALFFIKMDEKERRLKVASKDEDKRTVQNLRTELEGVLETFEEKHTIKTAGETFSFVNKFWNHGTYDMLTASAKIISLRSDLQQPTQTVFRHIKLHNQYLDSVLMLQGTDSSKLSRHCGVLEDCEAILKDEMPKLMFELKKQD